MRIRQLLANRWSNWDRGARKWSLQCCQLISPLNLCLDITALGLFFSFSTHFQYVWLRLFCRLLRSALLSISTFHLWGNFLLNPIICLHRSASYLDLKLGTSCCGNICSREKASGSGMCGEFQSWRRNLPSQHQLERGGISSALVQDSPRSCRLFSFGSAHCRYIKAPSWSAMVFHCG